MKRSLKKLARFGRSLYRRSSLTIVATCTQCRRMPKVNLDVEVRFGLSLNQGNRRDMEDTASFVADACGLRQKRLEAQQHSEDLSTTSPAATATVTSTGDTTSTPKHAAAYFGVYDGEKDGTLPSCSTV